MKNIAVLGSTGSIGQSTLDVIKEFPGEFRAVGLSTNSNVDLLYTQAKESRPEWVCIRDPLRAECMRPKLRALGIKLFTGDDGLCAAVRGKSIDMIVFAVSGSAALLPLLAAIDAGKKIALANKEALVMAGPLIMERARIKNAEIIPVDSEQSAIWQCLHGQNKSTLKRILLTASGGPLKDIPRRQMKRISLSKVLRHPRWRMGRKITVDSATLMNKGLELLEAMHLFKVGVDDVKILIHPEAIIHSMVEFVDGVIMAQMSVTDMRIPIQYALSYPERLENGFPSVDFVKLGNLHFEKPDLGRFPCLALAYRAARELGTAPAVMNAANEVCVESFLQKKINFSAIPLVVKKILEKHKNITKPALQDILDADACARRETQALLKMNAG